MIGGVALGKRYQVFPSDVQASEGNKEAWDLLLRLQQGESVRLLLHGACGTGKTHMVAATLNEIDRKWPHGRYLYWTLPRFAQLRREAISSDHEDPIASSMEAHIVVFDDVGAEQNTEWGLSGLYDCLEERSRKCLPTIMVTNASKGDLIERYGDRVLNRLIGTDGRIIEVKGENRRVTQAHEEIKPTKWTDHLQGPPPGPATVKRRENIYKAEGVETEEVDTESPNMETLDGQALHVLEELNTFGFTEWEPNEHNLLPIKQRIQQGYSWIQLAALAIHLCGMWGKTKRKSDLIPRIVFNGADFETHIAESEHLAMARERAEQARIEVDRITHLGKQRKEEGAPEEELEELRQNLREARKEHSRFVDEYHDMEDSLFDAIHA